MTDIVDRLQKAGKARIIQESAWTSPDEYGISTRTPEKRTIANLLCAEAADEIACLRAEREGLRALLKEAMEALAHIDDNGILGKDMENAGRLHAKIGAASPDETKHQVVTNAAHGQFGTTK